MAFDISPAVSLPTEDVAFTAQVFRNRVTGQEHLALTLGLYHWRQEPLPAVRIHSECLTGDVFGSLRCDCGNQLALALDFIEIRGHGLIVYLRQEGRGIGLYEKLQAYDLQAHGLDTFEANIALGHPPDGRSYDDAVFILGHYGLERIDLLTSNPDKVAAVEQAGVTVENQIMIHPSINPYNAAYLRAKHRWFTQPFSTVNP